MSIGGIPRPKRVRVGVIGGGVAGLMTAYHVKLRIPNAEVTVLEQGNYIPYQFGTSTRSAACSRQQFGCEHNITMSLYSTRFYERFGSIVGIEDTMFWQRGYLFLYKDDEKWQAAQRRVVIQHDAGLIDVRCLSPEDLAKEFPFVANDSMVGATFCPTDGFLDVGIILESLKAYLKDQGVNIRIKSEVVGFNFNGEAVTDVRLKNEEQLPFDIVVNCGGIWSSRIGKMLGTELPVAPEKRYLWSAEFRESADDFSSEDYRRIPFTVCTANGVSPYLKPEPATKGKHSFLLGCEHKVEPSWNFKPEDQDHVDSDFMPNLPEGFHTQVWEEVCKWLPFAENLGFRERVNGGFYETTPSHSPVIGFDPNHQNVIHCCGFSGHGVMHGPAAGATVADLIKFGEYRLVLSGDRNLSYASLMDGTREQESMKI